MSSAVTFFACLLCYVLWLIVGLYWPRLFFRPPRAEQIRIRLKLRVLFLVIASCIGVTLSLALCPGETGEKAMSFFLGAGIGWLMAFGTFLAIEFLLDVSPPGT